VIQEKRCSMSCSSCRTILAGLAGGLALNLVMLLTFRLLGLGWNGGGILLDPSLQSPKVIAVWTQLEPIPLVVTTPALIGLGLILFGVFHAFVYQWLSPAWPAGITARALRLAVLVFGLSFLFWEFFTPFNMFGEPLSLIGLELLFWAVIALAETFVIAAILETGVAEGKES
jgi:hypothetical protein